MAQDRKDESKQKPTSSQAEADRMTRQRLYEASIEDSFPASDPPSLSSPITGMGEHADSEIQKPDPSGLTPDFKNNGAAQFAYGRKSQHSTEHFDRSSRRLETGNPDVGEVDLGTIEADLPAQPDDHDHYDAAGEEEGPEREY